MVPIKKKTENRYGQGCEEIGTCITCALLVEI